MTSSGGARGFSIDAGFLTRAHERVTQISGIEFYATFSDGKYIPNISIDAQKRSPEAKVHVFSLDLMLDWLEDLHDEKTHKNPNSDSFIAWMTMINEGLDELGLTPVQSSRMRGELANLAYGR